MVNSDILMVKTMGFSRKTMGKKICKNMQKSGFLASIFPWTNFEAKKMVRLARLLFYWTATGSCIEQKKQIQSGKTWYNYKWFFFFVGKVAEVRTWYIDIDRDVRTIPLIFLLETAAAGRVARCINYFQGVKLITLWLFNIAMENHHFWQTIYKW